MTEKRRYPRYSCKIKTKFEFFIGDPDNPSAGELKGSKGKGTILDLSRGGSFIVSDARVSVGIPIKVKFATSKNKHYVEGKIVRTGLLKNNPSEVARRFANNSAKGDSYIAVEFNESLEELTEDEIS